MNSILRFSLALFLTLTANHGQTPRPTTAELIQLYGMSKIPHEGPWFLQTYKSPDPLDGSLGARYPTLHYAYTAILNLSTRRDFSAMHKLTTDEMWHFYLGDPLELVLLYPDGHGETVLLGTDVMHGQRVQFLVPKGVWQGSRPVGGEDAWSFLGNTLAPGFEYADYEPGYREELQKDWPKFADKITELTREDSVRRPAEQLQPVPPPPMDLTELAGRNAPVKSEQISIARFRLLPGAPAVKRKNLVSEEMIIVLAGTASLQMDGTTQSANAGGVLRVAAKTSYVISSTGLQPLEAYAICTPAFSPEQHEAAE